MIPCAHNPAAGRASAQIAMGLKIPRPHGRPGSIPGSGTTKHAARHVSKHYQQCDRGRIRCRIVGASSLPTNGLKVPGAMEAV